MYKRIDKLNWQRGDTIVEVLISIAVVSLVLGGAYVMTSRSLNATRSALERATGLKLAESQLERIKGLAASSPTSLFGGSAPATFCISAATNQPVATSTLNAAGQPTGTFATACAVDRAGNPTSIEPIYRISVTRTGYNFVLTEAWSNVTGKGADQLVLRYRVYD